uniref:Uncharacterized protein n=1 Tax=Human betaherpesvirus 6A TaxID=32603 RepID=A0A2L2Q8Q9_9BETA|nr:hypothetical protein [Human betaherpesvirus 6A]
MVDNALFIYILKNNKKLSGVIFIYIDRVYKCICKHNRKIYMSQGVYILTRAHNGQVLTTVGFIFIILMFSDFTSFGL